MSMQLPESSPIGFSRSAFAADGEVDEANLFQPDEDMAVDAEALASVQETAQALEDLFKTPVLVVNGANDEGDAVANEQAEEPEEVDALEALLQESLEPVRAKAELKELRSRMTRGGLSARERQEIEAKVREWEARVEWTNEANVALFTQQGCQSCGSVNKLFSGLLTRQRHRTQLTSVRWIALGDVNEKLPNEVAYRMQTVPFCALCAHEHKFSVESGYPLIVEV